MIRPLCLETPDRLARHSPASIRLVDPKRSRVDCHPNHGSREAAKTRRRTRPQPPHLTSRGLKDRRFPTAAERLGKMPMPLCRRQLGEPAKLPWFGLGHKPPILWAGKFGAGRFWRPGVENFPAPNLPAKLCRGFVPLRLDPATDTRAFDFAQSTGRRSLRLGALSEAGARNGLELFVAKWSKSYADRSDSPME